MAALVQSHSVDYSGTVLDLDDLSNIGHPCWEFFDPNPNIHKKFIKFNNLFFEGVLHNRVILEWGTVTENSAGETKSPKKVGNKHHDDHNDRKIRIILNESILRHRLRQEIIEQLLVNIDFHLCFFLFFIHHLHQIALDFKIKVEFFVFSMK